MRRILLLTLAAVSLAACSSETTSPSTSLDAEISGTAAGSALTLAGGYDAGLYETRLFNGLPDELKLTSEQRERIRALVAAFQQATHADRQALGAIIARARDAAKAGKTHAEIRAILDEGTPIRARLIAAEAKLKSDIDAVLTAEQRAWITSHKPQRCDPSKFPALTDAQKAQIRAIESKFAEANRADLEAVKAAHEQARAAIQAGTSREEVMKILEGVKDAMVRLAAARVELRNQLIAVLTPEQRASGCLPLG